MSRLEGYFKKLLAPADVELNGTRPWDIQVHDLSVCRRILLGGVKAIGDRYIEGDWDCEAPDQLVDRICRAGLNEKAKSHPAWRLHDLMGRIVNYGSAVKAFVVGQQHYDLGNDLYEVMLDKSMTYTCGVWPQSSLSLSLDEAQRSKNDLVCRKLGLQPGQRLLDVGSGWGALANHAAREYGAEVTGISVSKEQVAYANRAADGLPVRHVLQDYRKLEGTYDAAASIEMIEAVGHRNVRTYFKKVYEALKPGSRFVLQAIIGNVSVHSGNPWLNAHIFPNGMLLSLAQLAKGSERYFLVDDVEIFPPSYYDLTLMAWSHNLEQHRPMIEARYGVKRYRVMWLYLRTNAGAARSRNFQVCQIVMTRR